MTRWCGASSRKSFKRGQDARLRPAGPFDSLRSLRAGSFGWLRSPRAGSALLKRFVLRFNGTILG